MNKQTVSDNILQQLKQDILYGEFKPGEKLIIDRLKLRYQTSITPIREALCQLVQTGFACFEVNKGYRVTPVSIDDLNDVVDTWLLLSTKAMQNSIELGDDEWEAKVVAAYHRLYKYETSDNFLKDKDYIKWSELYHRFHDQVISACPSQWILKFERQIYDQTQRYRILRLLQERDIKKIRASKIKYHEQYLDLVLKRKHKQAIALFTEQVENIRKDLLQHLSI